MRYTERVPRRVSSLFPFFLYYIGAEEGILRIIIHYVIIKPFSGIVKRFSEEKPVGTGKFFFEAENIVRIDKFLKVSRILKRRTLAQEAANEGKVFVNGKECKPSKPVKTGDIVEVRYAAGTMKFRILSTEATVKKADAAGMYEIVTE